VFYCTGNNEQRFTSMSLYLNNPFSDSFARGGVAKIVGAAAPVQDARDALEIGGRA
jgi:hypothetical protein